MKELIATQAILIKLKITANVDQWKDTMKAIYMHEGPFDWLKLLLKGIDIDLDHRGLFKRPKWASSTFKIIIILFTTKRIRSCLNFGVQNEHLYGCLKRFC